MPDPLVLALVALLAPVIVGPLFIRLTVKGSPTVRFTPVDLDGPQHPPRLSRDYIERRATELAALGFDALETVRMDVPMSSIRTHIGIFRHRELADLATVITIDVSPIVSGTRYVELRTWLRDGTDVRTQNNAANLAGTTDASSTPSSLVHRTLPGETDLSRLYEVHRAIVASLGAERGPIEPGGECELLRASTEDDNRRYYESGDYALDGRVDEPARGRSDDANPYAAVWQGEPLYRPTWLGALRMTLRLSWPIRPIRNRRARREAERETAESLRAAGSG